MKRRTFPFFLCVIFLLVLIFLTGFLFALFFSPPAARVKDPVVLVLDEGWAEQLLACSDTSDRLDFLDAVPVQAEAWGCTGVLLSGRYGEYALFEDKTDSLALAPELDGTDPVSRLKKQCAKAGIAFYLLAIDQEGNPLAREDAPEWALKLAEKSSPTVLFAGQAEGFSTTLKGAVPYTDGKDLTLLDEVSTASLAALRQTGTGGVLGRWSDLSQDPSPARRLAAYQEGTEALPDTTLSQQAAICYPSDDFSTYYDTLCLTGTSDPDSEVLLNGQPVDRPGSKGVWTKAVSLAEGENTFTLTQRDFSQTVTVTYKTSSNWTPAEPESDGSVEAEPGQWLRVTADGIASLLADYEDSSTILGTIPNGAMARVVDSEEYVSSSKITWAYQLENGGWLRASDVELLEEDDPAAAESSFTGLSVIQSDAGEFWRLEGSGTPLYLAERGEDGSLTLTFYDAAFAGTAPQSGEMATAVEVGEIPPAEGEDESPAGFTLRFAFGEEEPLWGYTVRYGQDGVEILLKKTPRLSDNPDAPLEGVRILLDAGHGGEDNGASGCAGTDGPLEKDLNLALTLAAKARLEQLGAWVSLTRSDDSYLSLAQRLEMVNSQAPDFFISLHHNSIALTRDTLDVNGTECYWFTPQSEDLAAALTSRFVAAFGCNNRGAREDYYFVTRTTACPAVLLESGFVTTALEYERCTDEAGLWAEGGAVAEAVLSILEG